jgi:hypothetical protein
MSRLGSKVVAQAIVVPLIVLAATFTSTAALAASARPAQSDPAIKGGHGHANIRPITSHHW